VNENDYRCTALTKAGRRCLNARIEWRGDDWYPVRVNENGEKYIAYKEGRRPSEITTCRTHTDPLVLQMLKTPPHSVAVEREWEALVRELVNTAPEVRELRLTLQVLAKTLAKRLPPLPDDVWSATWPSVESHVAMWLQHQVQQWCYSGETWDGES
jgi:hypothetical protein